MKATNDLLMSTPRQSFIILSFFYGGASLIDELVKNLSAMQEAQVRILGWEDPLEKGKATHSSILARRILQTQSMVLLRVRHD